MVGKTITVRLLYSLINALEIIIVLVMLLVLKTNLIAHNTEVNNALHINSAILGETN
jgi:Ca2+/Na+ antiporter